MRIEDPNKVHAPITEFDEFDREVFEDMVQMGVAVLHRPGRTYVLED
jgi:hypothetical protein